MAAEAENLGLDPELLAVIVCPQCRADLVGTDDGALACTGCERVYPVQDGIPVLLVDEAR